MKDYTKINSETWDLWAENGCEWSIPITHEEYIKVEENNFGVYLTPCITVPREWFGTMKGKKILGLASGGGQQMPVFVKLGAECTIFDYSDRQLGAERMVAEREGYSIEIIKGDMTKPLPFEDESFDLIFHPVSNCYIEDVYHVWNECYRNLKKGGRLLSGFSNGLDFLFEGDNPLLVVNQLPFNPLKMPKERYEAMVSNGEGVQFSHSMEEQIGGQLKAGFLLKDLYEDRDREGGAKIRDYAPQYMATLAVKV
ncbi:MAG: class I SAM-dependent methyltransferase [Lachnospiraceae bacterium]|nr:class I SAM-dependent methyltransferase [Lachnospiraceae bacterium]